MFQGVVKNVGGTEARNVVVHLSVTEIQQGAECVRTDIEVKPSDLPPGVSGDFTLEIENPCFYGDVSLKLEPDWD